VAAVIEHSEWLVPAWGNPFQPLAPVAIQARLLSCPPTYMPVAAVTCRERLRWRPPPGDLPTPARRSLQELEVSVCDSTCEADGSRIILALSPPLMPDSLAIARVPDLASSRVIEVHALVPGEAMDGAAYGRNVVAVSLRRSDSGWSAIRLHPIQRQRWPAATIDVTRGPLEATVGDTIRLRWRALDAAGREIDFQPGWRASDGLRPIDPFTGVFLAERMGLAVILADAGPPPDGFQASVPVNVREPRVDPALRPAVTSELVERELSGIYEAVLSYYCDHDLDEGIVLLDPRIFPHGYHHHRMEDAPLHDEELLASVAERTCAEGVHEQSMIFYPRYRKVGLSPPVFRDEGEIEVEVVVHGRAGADSSWSSNTAYQLARHPDGWRVVKIQRNWIT
jgi:hypothetical protein